MYRQSETRAGMHRRHTRTRVGIRAPYGRTNTQQARGSGDQAQREIIPIFGPIVGYYLPFVPGLLRAASPAGDKTLIHMSKSATCHDTNAATISESWPRGSRQEETQDEAVSCTGGPRALDRKQCGVGLSAVQCATGHIS